MPTFERIQEEIENLEDALELEKARKDVNGFKKWKDFLKRSLLHDSSLKKVSTDFRKKPEPQWVKKLAGTKDGYRVRVGDYRILYTIYDRKKAVTI